MMLLSTLLLSAAPQAGLASTTGDAQLPVDPVCHDEALLLRHVGQSGCGVYWPRAAWFAQLGDADGNGNLDLLPGVDALTLAPRVGATVLTPLDLAFSTDANFHSFLDGDLLRARPGGGLEVLVAESELTAALQLTNGNFDLDGAHLDGQVLIFSVKDGLQSVLLGAIEDGDILEYDRASGAVQRLYSESDVQAMVDHADPGAGSLGDVRSVTREPQTGELCFSVQAPTSDDATLYGTGNGGRLIPGFAEADYGFQNSTELDAFTFLPQDQAQAPVMDLDVPYVGSGQSIELKIRHATPLGTLKGVMTRRRGFSEASSWGGMAAIFLDQADPLYQRQWQNGWMHPTPADASGSASFVWTAPQLPPHLSQVDHYFQALDLETLALSNPVVVRLR